MANRNVLINEDSLIDVANAIRGVTGSSAGLRVADMPSAINAYGAAASSDITALGGQIDAILENHGEKNLLVLSAKTTTVNGITYTVNADGTIKANGTATSNATLVLVNNTQIVPTDTSVIVSGCPSGGSNSTYRVFVKSDADANYVYDTGSGVTVSGVYRIAITIYSGTTVNNLVFKPMVRDSRIISSSYVKYNGDVDVV